MNEIRRSSRPPGSLSLLVQFADTTQKVTLREKQKLVVGRAAPADVVIVDPALSRQHARFIWDSEGIWVEDLDSSNGTAVNGRRVTRCHIRVGDRIQLGGTNVVIGDGARKKSAIPLANYEQLRQAIDQEVVRARAFGRVFTVVAIVSHRSPAAEWLGAVRENLRSVDVAASNGPSSAVVLFPECRLEHARVVAERIIAADRGWSLGCAIAVYPEAGASTDALLEAVNDLLPSLSPSRRVVSAGEGTSGQTFDVVITSPAMKRLYETVGRVAGADIPVLIIGETGTGKELIAREVHRRSSRAEGPLRSVNCAAIPQTLIESTLFGHEKGAFTGATATSPGVFEQADGGTLFLDEVGELSLATQAALLRVLETRQITRVGGRKDIAVNVRLLAATHKNLDAMAENGAFRSDLFYRLNAVTLEVPPLRERLEEIEPLIEHFIELGSRNHQVEKKPIEPLALQVLKEYRWPGNVRELRNIVERALVVASGDRITIADLPNRLHPNDDAPPPTIRRTFAPTPGTSDFKTQVRQFETELMLDALRQTGGNKTQAARSLRMPLRTFMHKYQTYDLDRVFASQEQLTDPGIPPSGRKY